MSGTPAKLFDNNNPDWLLTLKLGRQLRTKTSDVAASGRRYERLQGRREKAATASPGALASLCQLVSACVSLWMKVDESGKLCNKCCFEEG